MKNCALNNVSNSLNPSSAIQDRLIGRDNVDGISDFLYCFPEKHILIFTAILLELFSDILQCYKSTRAFINQKCPYESSKNLLPLW